MSSGPTRKPVVWLNGKPKSPPFAHDSRIEAGVLLRRLQEGESLGPPHSKPMPSVGRRCHELKVRDGAHYWRVIYRIDPDAILVLVVFPKGTERTPMQVKDACHARINEYAKAVNAARKRAKKAAPKRGEP